MSRKLRKFLLSNNLSLSAIRPCFNYRPHTKYGGRLCFYTYLSFCSQGVLHLPRIHHWPQDRACLVRRGCLVSRVPGQGANSLSHPPPPRFHDPTGRHTCFFFSNFDFFSAKLSTERTPCETSCLVPCKRVHYEPNLSYAQLSRINIERLIIDSEEKRQKLKVSGFILDSSTFSCMNHAYLTLQPFIGDS